MEKYIKLEPTLHGHIRTHTHTHTRNPGWINYLNVKKQNLKTSRRKFKKCLYDLKVGKD